MTWEAPTHNEWQHDGHQLVLSVARVGFTGIAPRVEVKCPGGDPRKCRHPETAEDFCAVRGELGVAGPWDFIENGQLDGVPDSWASTHGFPMEIDWRYGGYEDEAIIEWRPVIPAEGEPAVFVPGQKPRTIDVDTFVALIDDLKSWIQEGDSMEGTLQYAWGEAPGDYLVGGVLRFGNSMGQGGVRVLNETE